MTLLSWQPATRVAGLHEHSPSPQDFLFCILGEPIISQLHPVPLCSSIMGAREKNYELQSCLILPTFF